MTSLFVIVLLSYFLFNLLAPITNQNTSPTCIIITNCIFLLSLIISLTLLFWKFILVLGEETASFHLYNNLVTSLDLSVNIEVNFLSYSFSCLVIIIGFSANIYSLNYFNNEADENKLILLLNLFILSMLTLVLSNNFFSLFLGWELIGLTSFYLINFWSTNISVLNSALKAFTFNLCSDILFLGALVCFYIDSGVSNCTQFLAWIVTNSQLDSSLSITNSYTGFGALMLCLCASIKSVQIIMHLWLPDSMEAPVPASALIHSATLVSAGIFLLCKFNILIVLFNMQTPLAILGALTAAYGGLISAQQTDLNNLLAYSTMSHCGFMWFLSAYGLIQLTVIYLFLHGIFKAATFFCAGSFISFNNTQDSRWMTIGGVTLPVDAVLLLICSSNLTGLPFTIGYLYNQLFISIWFSSSASSLITPFLCIGLLSSVSYFYNITNYTLFTYSNALTNVPLSITSTVNYNIDSNFVLCNINHVIAVLFVIILGVFWTYLTYITTLSLFSLELYAVNELLITRLGDVIIFNNNGILLFYTLYLIVAVTILSLFENNNSYAAESLLTSAFIIFLLLFLY